MIDPQQRLERLRRKRDQAADPDDRADLDAAIAALEEKIAQQQVAMPDGVQAGQQQQVAVGGNAQVEVLITGNIAGNVTLALPGSSRRSKSAEQIIAAYLARLLEHYRTIGLQGLRDQRSATDVLHIELAQVYTQLATRTNVEREHLSRPDLDRFDAQAFLDRVLAPDQLPYEQRSIVQVRNPGSQDERGASVSLRKQDESFDLRHLTVDDLAGLAQQAQSLSFYGPQIVTEAIAGQRRLVLLGEPGSGKSTVLRYLTLMMAQASLNETFDPTTYLPGWNQLADINRRLLPIYVVLPNISRRLAESAGGISTDLWPVLVAELEADGRHNDLGTVLVDEWEPGRVILMFDGLDEIAGLGNRRQVVQAIQRFALDYPRSRFIVSCRVRAYQEAGSQGWDLPGWHVEQLSDWSLGQMLYFVRAWYRAAAASGGMRDDERDARMVRLEQALRTRPDLAALGNRPLLLLIMVLVHFNDRNLPEERTTLYQRCVDLLLGQWEMAGHDGSQFGTLTDYIGLPDADVARFRPLLQTAAYQAHLAGSATHPGSLSRDGLRTMIADELERQHHANSWQGTTRFLEYIDARAGLIHASSDGSSYNFAHQTIQEYLAGLELVRQIDWIVQIQTHRDDDRWRVPITLGLGHLVSNGVPAMLFQLFGELLVGDEMTIENHQQNVLFAAELGDDLGWERLRVSSAAFREQCQRLARALVNVVEGSTLSAEQRVRAGRYLGNLGDPRPGVTTLPPRLQAVPAGHFVLGSEEHEIEAAGQEYWSYYRQRNDISTANQARHWPRNELPSHKVTLSDFQMARYLVTNAQYAQFIAAGGYDPEAPWWDVASRDWLRRNDATDRNLKVWQRRRTKERPEFWHDPEFGQAHPNQPVVGVCWYEATAFCRWLTLTLDTGRLYRLPSEAEWEYVARGTQGRRFPWGDNQPDVERANFENHYRRPSAVGCYTNSQPDVPINDLAGNVWEWTRSVFAPYPYLPDDGREHPSDPAVCTFVARGGSWHSRRNRLRAATRNPNLPDAFFNDYGFRVVSDE